MRWIRPRGRARAAAAFRALPERRGGARTGDFLADVRGAASELRRQGSDRVVLIGSSFGGTAVLSAAPTVEPDPAGVVDVSGPLDLSARVGAFGSAADVAPRIRSPVLLLWARGDHRMPPDAGRAFLRAVRGRDKATASFPGGWHGVSLLEGVPAASRMLLAFLRRQR